MDWSLNVEVLGNKLIKYSKNPVCVLWAAAFRDPARFSTDKEPLRLKNYYTDPFFLM